MLPKSSKYFSIMIDILSYLLDTVYSFMFDYLCLNYFYAVYGFIFSLIYS
ncbi:hypothetical protein SLEP1_g51188 [Rubroshorea leprosula]|uniref:Uncharacterized protein n=1 Tax=Rubroshorea leprosula TaxID=152421 RepID=A0AAV5M2E0_9ROSI|nr:hypothetical protein SLEP1_g51188 [Rubroshorea leprosula]